MKLIGSAGPRFTGVGPDRPECNSTVEHRIAPAEHSLLTGRYDGVDSSSPTTGTRCDADESGITIVVCTQKYVVKLERTAMNSIAAKR